MSFPTTDTTMPSYVVFRDCPADQIDLTAPLAFYPPKDSDDLFDALRAKYPHLRTHSERTRQAVIEYLLQETQLAPMEQQLPTPQTAASVNLSPWEASMQSMSSDSSEWSSPELFNLATPSFGMSPQPECTTLTREQSVTTNFISPTATNPQPLEQMTGVFSLSDTAQPKQRIRRKMTEAEKIEYRLRRKAKACDKCAKRKRKCTHNQPETEVLASKPSKITKTSPQSQLKSPAAQTQQQQQQQVPVVNNMSMFDQSFMTDVSMPSFDDFTMLPQDPMLFADPSQMSWNEDDGQTWPLFDSDLPVFGSANGNNPMSDGPTFADAGGEARVRQQPTHTQHIHDSYGSNGAAVYDPLDNLDVKARPHAPQDGPWSPYIPVERTWAYTPAPVQPDDHNAANAANATGGSGRYPSLADMTLRMTATRKAVKAFGNLLPRESPRRSALQNISLKKVAILALSGLTAAQSLALNAPALHHSRTKTMTMTTSPAHRHRIGHPVAERRSQYNVCQVAGCSRDFSTSSDLAKHMRAHNTTRAGSMSLSTSMSLPDSNRGLPSHDERRTSSGEDDRDIPISTRASSGDDGDIPIPVPLQQRRYHQVKSRERSLGQGISLMKSPTTELYMLKRRLPSSEQSEMSRASAALNPLLMAVPNATALHTAAMTADPAVRGRTDAALPVHTRPTTTGSSGFEDASFNTVSRFACSGPSNSGGWYSNTAAGDGQVGTTATADSASALPKSISSVPTVNEAGVFRLNDHVRRRDHFGRQAILAGRAIAVLAALLLLSSLLPSAANTAVTGSLSLLLLALIHPIAHSEGRIHTAGTPFASQLWGTDIQFNIWNSAWSHVEVCSSTLDRTFTSLGKRIDGFLSRGHKIGRMGRINSIGKKAI